MTNIIVGLGNPKGEYDATRHNTGRMILEMIAKEYDGDDFTFDKKSNSYISSAKIGKKKVTLVAPETYMNNSGKAVVYFVKNKKSAADLIVIYDDFNLPLGVMKIAWNRSSGGHNGLESIINSVKTQEFVRIRVGTAPANTKGLAKVPHGDEKIEKFILGKFKEDEIKVIKKIGKKVAEAINVIVNEGKDKAMTLFNGN